MIALKIEDMKAFTSKLFLGEMFDLFLIREVTITTFNSFTIDGHIREGYYTDEELEENRVEDLSSWHVLKPICFSLIKGKKLPGSFQIIMQLPPEQVEQFIKKRGLTLSSENIQGLCINIRYEDQRLTCVTATSLNIFTMDKSLEREWDDEIRLFFKNNMVFVAEI